MTTAPRHRRQIALLPPAGLRPLGRSLDPIAGESLDGYLLQLCCGCGSAPSAWPGSPAASAAQAR